MFKRFYKSVSNEMHGEFVMSDVNVILLLEVFHNMF